VAARHEAVLRHSEGNPVQFQSAEDSYDILIGTPPHQGVCTLSELRGLASEELVGRLEHHQPQIGKNTLDRMRLVVAAKAHEEVDRTVHLPDYQKNALHTLTIDIANRLTPDDILAMSVTDIYRVLQAYYTQNPVHNSPLSPEDMARIEAGGVHEGLTRKYRRLVDSRLTHEVDYHQSVLDTAQENLGKTQDLEKPKADLDVAIRVGKSKNQEELFDRASVIIDHEAERTRLSDSLHVPVATDTGTRFTKEEIAADLPQGLLRWYELLDPEYSKENRGKSFESWSRILPKEKLAEILQLYLLDTNTTPQNFTIDGILLAAEDDFDHDRIPVARLQQTFQQIINHVREYGLKL
jgi:hypothetical protein